MPISSLQGLAPPVISGVHSPGHPNRAVDNFMSESDETVPTATATADATPSTDLSAFPVRQDLYDESYSDEEYQSMLDLYEGTLQSIQEGEIVKSKILRVTDSHVILDVGFKSEGAVPIEEFKDLSGVSPGDEVEVLLENLEDEQGSVVLSKKKADFMRVWEKIREAYENDQPVEGMLQKKIKGGAGDRRAEPQFLTDQSRITHP